MASAAPRPWQQVHARALLPSLLARAPGCCQVCSKQAKPPCTSLWRGQVLPGTRVREEQHGHPISHPQPQDHQTQAAQSCTVLSREQLPSPTPLTLLPPHFSPEKEGDPPCRGARLPLPCSLRCRRLRGGSPAAESALSRGCQDPASPFGPAPAHQLCPGAILFRHVRAAPISPGPHCAPGTRVQLKRMAKSWVRAGGWWSSGHRRALVSRRGEALAQLAPRCTFRPAPAALCPARCRHTALARAPPACAASQRGPAGLDLQTLSHPDPGVTQGSAAAEGLRGGWAHSGLFFSFSCCGRSLGLWRLQGAGTLQKYLWARGCKAARPKCRMRAKWWLSPTAGVEVAAVLPCPNPGSLQSTSGMGTLLLPCRERHGHGQAAAPTGCWIPLECSAGPSRQFLPEVLW